jgi:hypothetical protein
LTLEQQLGPVPMVVIDAAEHPTPEQGLTREGSAANSSTPSEEMLGDAPEWLFTVLPFAMDRGRRPRGRHNWSHLIATLKR